jgi:hypothetical protein
MIRGRGPERDDGYEKRSPAQEMWSLRKVLAWVRSSVSMTAKRRHIKFSIHLRTPERPGTWDLVFIPSLKRRSYQSSLHHRLFPHCLSAYNYSHTHKRIYSKLRGRFSLPGLLQITSHRPTSTAPTPTFIRMASIQMTMPRPREAVWQAVLTADSAL